MLSDTTTTFSGTILANGGPLGGNGGTIETSGGHVVLGPDVMISAAAPRGKAGKCLLDPSDLTIDATAAATISATLNGGTNVTEQTTATTAIGLGTTSPGNGDINVNAAISWKTSTTLTLSAFNSINIRATITVGGGGTLVLTTNNNIVGASSGNGSLTFALGQGSSSTGGAGVGAGLTINGSPYTLIYDTGSTATGIQSLNGSSGNFALATSLDRDERRHLYQRACSRLLGHFQRPRQHDREPDNRHVDRFQYRAFRNHRQLRRGQRFDPVRWRHDGGRRCRRARRDQQRRSSTCSRACRSPAFPESAVWSAICWGSITNSSSSGTMTGEIVPGSSSSGNPGPIGGLVGELDAGSVTGSSATGAVTALDGDYVDAA